MMFHYYPLIAVFLALTGPIAAERSPALIWSPERSMVDFPDVSTVDSFTASDFYLQYLSPLMHKTNENAVIFLQDKLSVDDFTKFADVYSIDSDGGAFKNVKRFMEDHFSLEVPQVDSPHKAIEMLQKDFEGEVHVMNDLSQLEPLKLGDKNRFLLIVNLHPTIGSVDEENAISQNDALVGDVIHHLQTKGIKYSALFTGKSAQSSVTVEPSDEAQHSSRHLMATSVGGQRDNCTFMNVTGTVYVFLCKIKVCVKSSGAQGKCDFEIDTLVTNQTADTSKRNGTSAIVNLELPNVKDAKNAMYDVAVSFEVSLHQDRWVMDRITLDLNQTSGSAKENKTVITNATLVNYGIDTVVPRLYSFHCTKMKLFLETVKDKTYKKYSGSKVTLEGFQFQVFNVNNTNAFFLAQDCVGFFTAGIWMGVLPGLLLLAIMVYGTMMVLNLSVMDKFDDPKGKTITVNMAE